MKYLISFLFLALAFSMKSEAKVTLPSILGDNMVLQQQAEVKCYCNGEDFVERADI